MNSKTLMVVAVTAILVLVLDSKLRSLPLVSSLPTL